MADRHNPELLPEPSDWSSRGARADRFRCDLRGLLARIVVALRLPRRIRAAEARELRHAWVVVAGHMDEVRRADSVASLRDFADLYCLLGLGVEDAPAPKAEP